MDIQDITRAIETNCRHHWMIEVIDSTGTGTPQENTTAQTLTHSSVDWQLKNIHFTCPYI